MWTGVSWAAGILLAIPSAAVAQTRTGQFAVRAEVVGDCQVAPNDLNFGQYNTASPKNGDTTFVVTCTPGIRAVISFSAGSSGNASDRWMTHQGGASTNLRYQLFSDASRQIAINHSGMAYELTSAMNPTGQPHTFQLYGRIPAGQAVAAGNYVDQVQITVQF